MTLVAAARPRDVLGVFGLYLHVPFCSHRCWYCDFNTFSGLDHLADAYMTALIRDVQEALSAGHPMAERRPEVTSVFIGGGTPSLVDAGWISGVLEAVRGSWPLNPDAEITIEANPESLSQAKLEAYLGAGIGRISIGVQALDTARLQTLGRQHTPEAALDALRAARRAGFEDINADLIVGIPGESPDDVRRSVEGVLEAETTHVSCYGLTYEEGTPLHAWRRLGRIVPVGEDEMAAALQTTDTVLTEAGFERYEISNWAKPGRRSLHNDTYWRFGEYLGLGAGAHSHLADGYDSRRSWTFKAPQRYIDDVQAGRAPVAGSEVIDERLRAAELMLLGLRRTDGVDRLAFRRLVGEGVERRFPDELERGSTQGLLEVTPSTVRLTQRGREVADGVAAWFC